MLLRHYENLYGDVELLVRYCGQRQVTLLEGFRNVCETIEDLRNQVRELEK